jgi:hypothetical protein
MGLFMLRRSNEPLSMGQNFDENVVWFSANCRETQQWQGYKDHCNAFGLIDMVGNLNENT